MNQPKRALRASLLASSSTPYRRRKYCTFLETRGSSRLKQRGVVVRATVDYEEDTTGSSKNNTTTSFPDGIQGAKNNIMNKGPSKISEEVKEDVVDDSVSQTSGTLWGAMALIIGSTIGAGILALPDITQDAGFVPSTTGLVGVWAFLVGQALLLAEVNINLMEIQAEEEEDATLSSSSSDTILTLRTMAEKTLGKGVGKVATGIYLSLSYCLLVAYLTKVGEIFSFASDGKLQSGTMVDVFALGSLGMFMFGGPMFADKLNQGLTSVLVALFMSILALGMAHTNLDVLFGGDSVQSFQAVGPAIPIMFLSLVYHDLIPLICSYLGGDRKRTQQALVLGSLVPLAMFISWEAVTLSFFKEYNASGIHSAVYTSGHIDPVNLMISASGSPLIGSLVQGFSFVAIATSFLGTTMGVSETIRSEASEFDTDDEQKLSDDVLRNVGLTATLIPPLLFTTSGDPKAFIQVLSVAGGYGMTLLYGIFPPLMAWKLRETMKAPKHAVPGGNLMLGSLLSIGISLGIYRVLQDAL
ncbi:hypothetical protein M9435_006933 [Picochlorum sp. BPE23]|nr:hypothetical protein M9435_006933 [Picochlorum sp. BPE23]